MTAERWVRILELFELCRSQPSECRAVLLVGVEADLVAEVEQLLRQDQDAGEFLEDAPDAVKKLHLPPEARFAPRDCLAGRYHILQIIGVGGMGEVYAALDQEAESTIALKVMHTDMLGNFRRELQIGRQVTHPNVCRLFDIGRHAGVAFLTMELVEGESLAARLRRTGPLRLTEAQTIVEQLVRGLTAIHQMGIVHLDLTPSNIMLTPGRAVIMDFGLADRCAPGVSRVMGTRGYMAPEQLKGQPVTELTDIYALGVLLSEMVMGSLSHHDLSGGLPRSWSTTIQAAISHNPSLRPSSAEQVLDLLAIPPLASRRIRHKSNPLPRGRRILARA